MNSQPTTITAKVERIRYPKQNSSLDGQGSGVPEPPSVPQFYILSCDVGVCKGKLDHLPKAGEALTLDGKWEVSQFNGQPEFVFFHAKVFVPADERALLRYACEMTPGFGPAMEERIWTERGENWRGVSLADDIRGLTPDKLAALQKTIDFLNLNQERAKAVSWLVSIGLTIKMAEAAFAKWGSSTVARVEADPYVLAQLPNYGFSDADSHVRAHFKIERNDLRRVNAALKYYLAQLSAEDTAVLWDDLAAKVHGAIDSDPQLVADACRAMFQSGALVSFPRTMRIASLRDFTNEALIYRFANPSGGAGDRPRPFPNPPKARQPKVRDFDLDETQMEAVQFALDHRFSIINGSAGTGKTSLIHALCDSIDGRTKFGQSVRLCAFAGKAAARLREATMHDASTIHRMLGWMGEANKFALKTLAGSTVILDEASMVSSDLLAEIVKRNPDRLILVGDEAQLPPVGSGQPFHDLVKLLPCCVRTLSTCYRSREAVLASALAIRAGNVPPPEAKSESESYEFCSCADARRAHSAILDAVKRGDVDFDRDIILCCRNGDTPDEPCSVRSLNADIKQIVNSSGGSGDRPRPFQIDPGDRIICTQNSSDLDVWNGTTGRCRGFDTARAMWVDLDFPNSDGETSVLIPKDKVKDWQLAYALTVHKSQGSQYRRVVFLVTRRDTATLLSRPMIYTAVTRAKHSCRVIGDAWAFSRAVSETRPKHTVMQEIALENNSDHRQGSGATAPKQSHPQAGCGASAPKQLHPQAGCGAA